MFDTRLTVSGRPLVLSGRRGSVTRRDLKATAGVPVLIKDLATKPDKNLYLSAFTPRWIDTA